MTTTLAVLADSQRKSLRPTTLAGRMVRGTAAVLACAVAVTMAGALPASADSASASLQVPALAPAVPQSLSLPAAPITPKMSQLGAFDSALLQLINTKRQGAGLVPLTEMTGLDAASAKWSQAQVAQGKFAPLLNNPAVAADATAAGVPTDAASAQSLAKWFPQTTKVADVFVMLTGYPDALNKLMNPSFKYVGIRTSADADGTSVAGLTYSTGADPTQLVDPKAAFEPTGALTAASELGAVVNLTGTAADPDATNAVQVRVTDTVNGAATTTVVPVSNGQFAASVTMAGSGTHTLCATVINQGVGDDLNLGCTTAQMAGLVGGLQTVVTGRGTAQVAGWAVDPDGLSTPVTIDVVSRTVTATTDLGNVAADVTRPDVAASFPGAGADHGFSAELPATPGPQTLCAVATTVKTGQTVQLGCQDVVVQGVIIGNADTLRQSGSNLTATGWGYDQASPTTSLTATITTSGPAGSQTITVPASVQRLDVIRYYPTIGTAHGYSVVVPAEGKGLNKMCVTLSGATADSTPRDFPCKTITVS